MRNVHVKGEIPSEGMFYIEEIQRILLIFPGLPCTNTWSWGIHSGLFLGDNFRVDRKNFAMLYRRVEKRRKLCLKGE